MAEFQEGDLSKENIASVLNQIEESMMFGCIDMSFLTGIQQILQHSQQQLKNVELPDIYQNNDPEIQVSFNEAQNLLDDFFRKLSYEWQEISRFEANRARYLENQSALTSTNTRIAFDNTLKSVVTMAHELIHNMSMPENPLEMKPPVYDNDGNEIFDKKEYTEAENQQYEQDKKRFGEYDRDKKRYGSYFDKYFIELDSEYGEMLIQDHLRNKYGENLDLMDSTRMFALKEMQNTQPGAAPQYLYLMSGIELLKMARETPLNEEKLPRYQEFFIQENSKYGFTNGSILTPGFNGKNAIVNALNNGQSLVHEISYLIANHVHQSINMNNPEKASEMLYLFTTISALHDEFLQEKLEKLTTRGLPFTLTADGKLGMTQENINAINNSFDKTLNQYLARNQARKQQRRPHNQSIAETEIQPQPNGDDKVRNQLLEAINNPPSLAIREEAKQQLEPQRETELNKEVE